MDYTEEALCCMHPRELDVIFAEAICGLHILNKNPFGFPGLVVDAGGLTMVPPFSSSHDASPCAIERIHQRGFTFVRMLGNSGYRCQVSRNGWLLSDVSLPLRGNSMRVLIIAAILAAQRVCG
jgi:hypothetical protein